MIYFKKHLNQMILLTFIQSMASNLNKKILINDPIFLAFFEV